MSDAQQHLARLKSFYRHYHDIQSAVRDINRELNEQKAEIERLQSAIREWDNVTQFAGTHRSCPCAACEKLRKAVGDE